MNRYLLQEELGDGTFGTVFRAIRRHDNKVVSNYFHPTAMFLLVFVRWFLSYILSIFAYTASGIPCREWRKRNYVFLSSRHL